MNHPVCMLKNIATVTSGQSAPQGTQYFSDHGTPFVRAGSLEFLTRGRSEDDCEKISERVAQKFHLRLLPADTILFAKSGMSAKIGRVYRLKSPCYVVSHLAAVIPGPKIVPSYLQRWFERFPPSRLIPNEAYPSIRLSEIERLQIPVPPLPEQKRIATILDKADAIRRKRQQAIKLADEFLRSVFLDMFGDPVTNPKGWPLGTIRKLVSDVKYGTSKKANESTGEYPILRMNNISYEGNLNLTNLKYIDLNENEKEKYFVHKGDLLFNRTNSKELVGKTAVYDRDTPMAFAGYLIRVRSNRKSNPYYLSAYLNSKHGKATLQNMCKSIIGMANINAQEFQEIKILIPPVELQTKYSKIVGAAMKKKKTLGLALANCAELFASLTQRAFRGEL